VTAVNCCIKAGFDLTLGRWKNRKLGCKYTPEVQSGSLSVDEYENWSLHVFVALTQTRWIVTKR